MQLQVAPIEPHPNELNVIKPLGAAVASEVTTTTQKSTDCSLMPSRPVKLSSFERLPVQVLQHIFLESLNFNLPRGSPALCSALSSKYIKIKLFMCIFAEHQLCQELGSTVKPYTAQPDEHSWDVQRPCSTFAGWLTMDIMKEFMEVFLLQTVLSVLGKSSDWAVSESQDGRTGVLSNTVLADSILRGAGMRLERKSSQTARCREMHILRSCGVLTVEERRPRPSVGETKLNLMVIDFVLPFIFRNPEEHIRQEMWILPKFDSRCQIPLRLLHGPWTDEKSDFLEFLMRLLKPCNFGKQCYPAVTGSNLEMADSGLLEAIREGNMRATKNLVYVLFLENQDATDNEEKDFSQPRDRNTNRFVITQDDREHKPKEICRPWVGVVPQTHHLRVAVLEKGCPKHIVSWLYIARKSKIDWNDDQVMDWAARKEAEGEEIGSWLLGLRKDDSVEGEDVGKE